jgi:hypothetical protein
MDAQDCHVLAAALSADADILLTDNARHWMAARHVELLTSAQLLTRLAGFSVSAGAHRVLLPAVRSMPYSSRPLDG